MLQIIDEKSLIKKYQKEISVLKEELDHLRQGMLIGVNHEELMTLRQKVWHFPFSHFSIWGHNYLQYSSCYLLFVRQLEEGQVKMQSRLEEEEEAKAALMSRIQRLTKLILVSTKNTIPGSLSDLPSHQRRHSVGEEDVSSFLNNSKQKINSFILMVEEDNTNILNTNICKDITQKRRMIHLIQMVKKMKQKFVVMSFTIPVCFSF